MDARDRSPGTHDVTELLVAWRAGDASAFEALIPLVYAELQRRAHHHLRGESGSRTLQTADLVHETYLRLVDARRVGWQNRAHFLAVASQFMRRILVDAARARSSLKRGGDQTRVPLDPDIQAMRGPDVDLVALDQALDALAAADPRRAHVVEMKFFGGLEVHEMAEVLGVSSDTVSRDWKVAKAWLFSRLRPPADA